MIILTLLKSNESKLQSISKIIIDLSKTDVVLRKRTNAVKIARIENISATENDEKCYFETENEINIETLRNEIKIYKIIETHYEILQIFHLFEHNIEMINVKRSSLSKYIRTFSKITTMLKTRWIKIIINTFFHVHIKFVIVENIAFRNFLVHNQLIIKLINSELSKIQFSNLEIKAKVYRDDILSVDFIDIDLKKLRLRCVRRWFKNKHHVKRRFQRELWAWTSQLISSRNVVRCHRIELRDYNDKVLTWRISQWEEIVRWCWAHHFYTFFSSTFKSISV